MQCSKHSVYVVNGWILYLVVSPEARQLQPLENPLFFSASNLGELNVICADFFLNFLRVTREITDYMSDYSII
jgi:hypothetical protein